MEVEDPKTLMNDLAASYEVSIPSKQNPRDITSMNLINLIVIAIKHLVYHVHHG